MDIASLYKIFCEHPSVQTDTRKLKKGDIFFALKGDRFNGNEFALQALAEGAAYAVVDEDCGNDSRLIRVEDCLTTLQQLAGYHRNQFSIPFIAITGSNGKTTTKELVNAVLSSSLKTYTTEGNLNNHIGIPLTLLRVKQDAEVAIIEMGANHQKEIAGYCAYARPTHGLITNCGKAHLEGFGGEAGVRKGKGELFDHIRSVSGAVFVYSDFDYLKEMSTGIPERHFYGTASGELTGITLPGELLKVKITSGMGPCEIQTNLVGEYNLPNVLAAVCIGKHFNIPEDKIISAIENYVPSNSRSQLMRVGSNEIIMDAYNANPSSMKVAIENFAKMAAKEKVVLLGGMMELGNESLAEHAQIVALLQQHPWKQVVLVGKDFTGLPAAYLHFNEVSEAREWYRQQHFENCSILIKGSRSMQMEKLLS